MKNLSQYLVVLALSSAAAYAQMTTGSISGSVQDPNGATVMYAYDGLSRLRKVAQPGDSLADPSEEWRYYDGVETSRTMTASGFTQGPFVTDHRVRGVAGTRRCIRWSGQ